jgi:predicted  nucleic acid-binding Zn-ribbon protein
MAEIRRLETKLHQNNDNFSNTEKNLSSDLEDMKNQGQHHKKTVENLQNAYDSTKETDFLNSKKKQSLEAELDALT